MTKRIAQQLESANAQASMRETAKHLRGAQDWQYVQEIQTHSAQARQNEQEHFREDYAARVADARDAIFKERAARHYTHPAPQNAAHRDRFDKDQIERQAHLRVHHAHHQTLAKIDVEANRAVKQLAQRYQPQPTYQAHSQAPETVPQRQIKRERFQKENAQMIT